jgi:hypothetical protein
MTMSNTITIAAKFRRVLNVRSLWPGTLKRQELFVPFGEHEPFRIACALADFAERLRKFTFQLHRFRRTCATRRGERTELDRTSRSTCNFHSSG